VSIYFTLDKKYQDTEDTVDTLGPVDGNFLI
jgi:hypothetical protein